MSCCSTGRRTLCWGVPALEGLDIGWERQGEAVGIGRAWGSQREWGPGNGDLLEGEWGC